MNVLVFGGTSGIGKAIVKKFMDEGHQVYVATRRNEVKEHIATGYFYGIDATKGESYENLTDLLVTLGLKFEVLIHTVGDITLDNFENFNPDGWLHMLEVNTLPALLMFHHMIKFMENKSYWWILGSTAGIRPRPDFAAYSLSKVLLHGLIEMMSEKLKPHVLVNGIAAGRTDTPMRLKMFPKGEDKTKLMNPDEIANFIYFTCLSKSFIYGNIIEIKRGEY